VFARVSEEVDDLRLSEPSFWLRSDREEAFLLLRREAPVSRQQEPETIWSDGGRGYWAVTRHADVQRVSRETKVFASGLGTELIDLPLDIARSFSGMINMDAPEHTRMRKMMNAAFTPRRIAQLREDVRRRAVEIVDNVCERGECDFATEVADALPTAVICDLLGIPEVDRDEISRISRATHPLGDPEFGTFEDAYHAACELIEYGKALFPDRLERPSDDLASALAAAVARGELSDQDAGTYFELLITAGIETTGAATAHGLFALSNYPGQRDRWLADYDNLAPTAIEEILRWSTPVVHFRRTATVDTQLAGQPIAAGDKVVLFYNSANRDDAVFSAPATFDVGRAPNPHVTFGGGGSHFCLGAHLSRLEMTIIFKEIFERLPDITIAGPPSLMHSMFFNGVKSMPCTFSPQPRSPSQ
jgi:methyl-branched lipid omega-hydroxylase